VALLRGNPPIQDGGDFLLWDVHQDTVPVDGMTVDPFGGDVCDGRVYGRGACDVKGSMAAMLAAISRAAQINVKSRNSPTIAIAFTVNEECGFTGVEACCQLMQTKGMQDASIVSGAISPTEMFPRLPDAAIVAEPTEFKVVVAHQGVVRLRCHTIGRAAHTSRPEAGINAIYGMAQIVQALECLHVALQKDGPSHPLCGRPTACVSTIHGGVGINTVPERATIEIDRRIGPNERPENAYEDISRLIVEQVDVGRCRVELDPPTMQSRGLSDERNQTLAKSLAALVEKWCGTGKLIGVPYATDAAAIAAAGVPTVVFGPGSIAQAHTADEFIEVDALRLATDIFQKIATEGLR
jgi:acetylornithine deacetylase